MENLSGIEFRTELLKRLDTLITHFEQLENLKYIGDGLVMLHNQMEKIHWTSPQPKVQGKKPKILQSKQD
ncbi:unnamed protein product [marine sediment metagenome]|uniref:Uncharacterized protein n=1 Tax=marine sediment metagenome TaxID=412755 RepID=X0WAV1_9ZZZZ